MATGTRARRAGGAAPGWALTRAVLYGRSAPFFRARPGQCLLPAELAGPRTRAAGGPTPYGLASPSPHLSAAPALPGGPRSTGPGRACPRPSIKLQINPESFLCFPAILSLLVNTCSPRGGLTLCSDKTDGKYLNHVFKKNVKYERKEEQNHLQSMDILLSADFITTISNDWLPHLVGQAVFCRRTSYLNGCHRHYNL
ncbi:uncharacterized protein LOC119063344 isoform X2 [Artibeus jamaicensis]|uniref:uncharacterized protein LOC119063344 isoform X2 n=1 Tax=Artibeus jamaicensis TaxID=9417 RepID=UPI00235ACA15|nr:uncharacterized protein LOC119063344 isoform X2 [Artibeus jamaicensis]